MRCEFEYKNYLKLAPLSKKGAKKDSYGFFLITRLFNALYKSVLIASSIGFEDSGSTSLSPTSLAFL